MIAFVVLCSTIQRLAYEGKRRHCHTINSIENEKKKKPLIVQNHGNEFGISIFMSNAN
jgi:hypothetical protein